MGCHLLSEGAGTGRDHGSFAHGCRQLIQPRARAICRSPRSDRLPERPAAGPGSPASHTGGNPLRAVPRMPEASRARAGQGLPQRNTSPDGGWRRRTSSGRACFGPSARRPRDGCGRKEDRAYSPEGQVHAAPPLRATPAGRQPDAHRGVPALSLRAEGFTSGRA